MQGRTFERTELSLQQNYQGDNEDVHCKRTVCSTYSHVCTFAKGEAEVGATEATAELRILSRQNTDSRADGDTANRETCASVFAGGSPPEPALLPIHSPAANLFHVIFFLCLLLGFCRSIPRARSPPIYMRRFLYGGRSRTMGSGGRGRWIIAHVQCSNAVYHGCNLITRCALYLR